MHFRLKLCFLVVVPFNLNCKLQLLQKKLLTFLLKFLKKHEQKLLVRCREAQWKYQAGFPCVEQSQGFPRAWLLNIFKCRLCPPGGPDGHLLPPLLQPPAADQSPLLAEHQVVQQEGLVEWNQLAGMKERSYSIISFEKIYSLVKVCSPAI